MSVAVTRLGCIYIGRCGLPFPRRPDRVGLVFGRQVYRNSRHRFRTRVITDGVTLVVAQAPWCGSEGHRKGRPYRNRPRISARLY